MSLTSPSKIIKQGSSYALYDLLTPDNLTDQPGITIGPRVSEEERREVAEVFFHNSLPYGYGYSLERFIEPDVTKVISAVEAIDLISCRNAFVAGHDSVVFFREGKAIKSTIAFVNAHLPKSNCTFDNGSFFLKEKSENADFVPGKFFLGFTAPYFNYAHWTTDTLPMWWYFYNNLLQAGYKLVLPTSLLPFHKAALSLMNITDGSVFYIDNLYYCFEELVLNTQISLWSLPKITGEAFKSLSIDVGSHKGPSGRRVFLSRGDVKKRNLLNEADAVTVFESFGFEKIMMSTLTLREQMNLMANASIVAGIHGAALANFAYCRPGTHVLEIFPEYCMQPEFRAIANMNKLNYSYISGTAFEFEDSRKILNAWDNSFVLEKQVLRNALTAISLDVLRSEATHQS